MVSIPIADQFWIRRARVPGSFVRDRMDGATRDAEGSALLDVRIARGLVAEIAPSGSDLDARIPVVDLQNRHLWPTLVDMHTHIDKSQVISRIGSLGASFSNARAAINTDRSRHWNRQDIRERMEFSIRCAYVHGVCAIRTHIDSYEGQAEASWEVFAELRTQWRGRVALQATSSVPIDVYATDYGRTLADLAAATEGGVLGGVLRRSDDHQMSYIDNIGELLDAQFGLAKARGLGVDLHVDETLNAGHTHLDEVARAVIRHGLEGRVVCGHCCSLSALPERKVEIILALCAQAGIGIVSLPSSNMYLHDRVLGRTPRLRGVTLIHEIRARKIPFAIASDNVRDSFYPFGDYDMLDTFRQSVAVYHLDQGLGEALEMIGPAPARMIGVEPLGSLSVGAPANLILLNARSLNEIVCRPQADRIVLNAGRQVQDRLPEFPEMRASPA